MEYFNFVLSLATLGALVWVGAALTRVVKRIDEIVVVAERAPDDVLFHAEGPAPSGHDGRQN